MRRRGKGVPLGDDPNCALQDVRRTLICRPGAAVNLLDDVRSRLDRVEGETRKAAIYLILSRSWMRAPRGPYPLFDHDRLRRRIEVT